MRGLLFPRSVLGTKNAVPERMRIGMESAMAEQMRVNSSIVTRILKEFPEIRDEAKRLQVKVKDLKSALEPPEFTALA
jgi:hypothetical protein